MLPALHGNHTVRSVFNFNNAEAFAFLLMLCFSIYHGVVMLTRPDKSLCKSLLSDGNVGPTGEWRPFGCMTHMYTTKDSHACLEKLTYWHDATRLYFIGDSRLATLFEVFARHLNSSWLTISRTSEPVVPISWKAKRFTLCFFRHDEITPDTISLINNWRSAVSLESVHPPLPSHNHSGTIHESECFLQPPSHLVLSFGTHTILRYNRSDLGLMDYQKSLEMLVPILSDMSFMRIVWMLLDPVAEGLLLDPFKVLTNKAINNYNNIAQRVLESVQGVELWRSNRLIAQRMGFPAVSWHCPQEEVSIGLLLGRQSMQNTNDSFNSSDSPICERPPPLSDGFHVSTEAMYQDAQILLNLYCNNQMNFEDGTCCRSPEPITTAQKRCFIFIFLCLLTTVLCFLYDTVLRSRICSLRFKISFPFKSRCCSTREKKTAPPDVTHSSNIGPAVTMFQDFYELLCSLSKFGLILIYFFVCDRTPLFMKTNKGFTTMSFLLPLVYLFVLGLFFSGPTKETRINHVDITREWKGWMQIYFLIYHFTGSYRVVPVYLFTRYFTSAYLFLSGFGHFHYYWHHSLPDSLLCKLIPFRLSLRELRNVASTWWSMLHRYLLVMYRTNFFVIGLCLVMNRDYLFYFFVPLVSFWFSVITLLMLSCPRVSATFNQPKVDRPTCHTHVSNSKPVLSPRSLSPCAHKPDAEINHIIASSLSTHSIQDIDIKSSSDTPRYLGRLTSMDSNFVCNLRSAHSSSTLDWRGHQKTLSLGTGFDVRQWNKPSGALGPTRTAKKSKVTQSGPPWTEDLLRKAWSVVPSSQLPWNGLTQPSVVVSIGNSLTTRSRRFCCSRMRLADFVIVLKLVTLIIAIEMLYRSPFYFHSIFFKGPQRKLFQLETTAPNPMEPFGDERLVHEDAWFYRWSIDRYSVIYGMIFALLCEWARRFGYLNDSHSEDLGLPAPHSGLGTEDATAVSPMNCKTSGSVNRFEFSPQQPPIVRNIPPTPPDRFFSSSLSADRLSLSTPALKHATSTSLDDTSVPNVTYPSNFRTTQLHATNNGYGWLSKLTCRRFAAIMLTLLGVLGIGLCMLTIARFEDPAFAAVLHPFLCFLPILSYIVARNCLGVLRRNHSVLFAWVGDISLELFIAQYHIWLSADGNGILVLLPGYPLLNVAVTSFVFVCICCEVHNLTRKLQRFLVPDSVFQLIRNVFLIGLIFHLITNVHEAV